MDYYKFVYCEHRLSGEIFFCLGPRHCVVAPDQWCAKFMELSSTCIRLQKIIFRKITTNSSLNSNHRTFIATQINFVQARKSSAYILLHQEMIAVIFAAKNTSNMTQYNSAQYCKIYQRPTVLISKQKLL